MASIYKGLDKLEDAELFTRKSLDLSERAGDYHNQAVQLIRLGDIQRIKKDYKAAESTLLDGLKKIQKVGDINWEGQACQKLGWLYRDLGKKSQAAEYSKMALAIYTRLDNKEAIEAVVPMHFVDYGIPLWFSCRKLIDGVLNIRHLMCRLKGVLDKLVVIGCPEGGYRQSSQNSVIFSEHSRPTEFINQELVQTASVSSFFVEVVLGYRNQIILFFDIQP